MIQLPKFTQYYIVSTIIPGVFNLSLIVFIIKITKLEYICTRLWKIKDFVLFDYSPSRLDWLFIIIFSVLFTLLLGMWIERVIFCCVKKRKNNNETYQKYDDLRAWREDISKKLSDNNNYSSHLIESTEKLMSEYYCLNNIIPSIVISVLIAFFSTLFSSPDDIKQIVSGGLIFMSLLFLLFLIRSTMQVWLSELYSMLKQDK